MRALTLMQPWASVVMLAPSSPRPPAVLKTCENRPKRTVPQAWDLRACGAIHAGKGWDGDGFGKIFAAWPDYNCVDYPAGVLLGMARIDQVLELPRGSHYGGVEHDEAARKWLAELRTDPWCFGPWCIQIGEVRPLDEPIECPGMLGFWTVEPALPKVCNRRIVAESMDALEALVPAGGRTYA